MTTANEAEDHIPIKPPTHATLTKASVAVITLFIIILALSPFYPVYMDDISSIVSLRAGYDGWQSTHSYPQCGISFATPIPFLLLPGNAWSWIIYIASPITIIRCA
jgi:hypothetical protein